MKVLLMRHGIATDRETWDGTDADRPLTKEGQDKTNRAARGLHRWESHLDLIATSPLLRARQTAEIARQIYEVETEIWPELESADYEALIARLHAQSTLKTILLVGHEPGLSRFTTRLLFGRTDGFVFQWKKAAVCALEIEFAPRVSSSLLWFAPPRMLRKI